MPFDDAGYQILRPDDGSRRTPGMWRSTPSVCPERKQGTYRPCADTLFSHGEPCPWCGLTEDGF